MKIQNTNQGIIENGAAYNASFIVENVVSGMTIDEAVKAHVDSAMDENFDEENFDAPYDRDTLTKAYKAAALNYFYDSPQEVVNYAQIHRDAHKSDIDVVVDHPSTGEPVSAYAKVIEIEGKKLAVIEFGDEHDAVFVDKF